MTPPNADDPASIHRRAVSEQRRMDELFWASPPGFDRRVPDLRRTVDMMVVSRRVWATPKRITALVGDPSRLATILPGDCLLVVGPMAPSAGIVGTTWTGRGRIRRARRAGALPRRSLRVGIEIASWSAGAGEIRITPQARQVSTWSKRRFRHYFEIVHAAADHLRREFHEPSPAPLTAAAPDVAHGDPLESAA